MTNFKIKSRIIKNHLKPYIIAEACINHEGSIEHAIKMIAEAKKCGADCIKFQIHNLDNEMLKKTPLSDNFKNSLWDTLKKTNFDINQQKILKENCEKLNIDYLCTPFSRDGADQLDSIGVEIFKIGSGEMTNLPLIEHIAKKKKPMIVSTGMSNISEIEETVNLIKSIGTPLMLTHCTSVYPCPYKLSNLKVINKLNKLFSIPVGLSDHTSTIYTSLGAIAHGACLIEKHFTLDKKANGPDHASSIEPQELKELVIGANAIFEANGEEKKIFEEERQVLAWARESVVTEKDIEKGDILNKQNVWVKRPGPGNEFIPAKDYTKVLGKTALKEIKKDTQIKWQDISD
jgi:sialic acid synthase SpsE